MPDIDIRISGRAGRITLTRPKALNALSYDMCMAIDTALCNWRDDDDVDLVVIDAESDKAFCAGGDIAELYHRGQEGDYEYGRQFWRDEYRLNALISEYPKPVVSLMQGFTMGGGVGIGCHGSHRIVCETTQISMPECSIGLVPDVGGCYILSKAPDHLGAFLGLTGYRLGAHDAIYTGFADSFISQELWPDLIDELQDSGRTAPIDRNAQPAPEGKLAPVLNEINDYFGHQTLDQIRNSLRQSGSEFSTKILGTLSRNAPISMACTLEILRHLGTSALTIRAALEMEYRFTSRAMEHGDLLEGIRAQIIDKDRNPQWKFPDFNVPNAYVSSMLAPPAGEGLAFYNDK